MFTKKLCRRKTVYTLIYTKLIRFFFFGIVIFLLTGLTRIGQEFAVYNCVNRIYQYLLVTRHIRNASIETYLFCSIFRFQPRNDIP
jgi:hypothetical protein